MINAFDTDVAQDVGMAAAVLYKNIQYWCEKNRANGMHEHDGLTWTYNSIKAYKELFPYLPEKTIRRSLELLEKKGYIKVGCFNDDGRDRTRWYADLRSIKNNMDEVNEDNCICPNGQMQEAKKESSKKENAFSQTGEPLPNNYIQITTKKERKKVSGDSARAKEPTFDEILDSVPQIKDNPEFRKAFVEFIKMRKLIKAPLTNRALELAINDAFKYGKGNVEYMTACVNQSVSRSWRGIFDIRPEGSPEPQPRSSPKSVNPYTDLRNKLAAGGEL